MVTPPASSGRIVELDALRGVAVLGIALMNVYVFALPAQAYYNPLAWGHEGPADMAAWWFGFVFVEDKFRTLFAMLFGAGVAMLWERDNSGGWRGHLARMAVLFALGIVHAVLLASNDVLRAYALAGLALPFLIRAGIGRMLGVAAGLLLLHILAGLVWLESQSPLFWEMNFGSDPRGLTVALERGSEPLDARIARRIVTLPASLGVVVASVPLNLATMLVGVAAWKSGLLAARREPRRLVLFGVAGSVLMVPCLAAFAAWAWAMEFYGGLVAANALVLSAPFDLLLGLAYAALFMALFQLHRNNGFVKRLAAVGRLSLTNYLLTSLVLAALFADWGLGWFAEVSRSEALALALVPIAAMVLWSPAWLARFGQGPFERLWRRAAAAIGQPGRAIS